MDCVIDHYWLPWDSEQKTDWASYDSFKEARADRKQKATQPGLLMFRCAGEPGNDKPDEAQLSSEVLLYIFIVGETPTTGINGEQFRNADEYIHQLPRPAGQDIHILGPITSGSVDSLRRLTSDPQEQSKGYKQPPQKKQQDDFMIYSGTVSTKANLDHFRRFVQPISGALASTVKILQNDHGIKNPCQKENPEAGILVESETVLEDKLRYEIPPEIGKCYDWFGYPREIASLRNAYKAATEPNPATGNNPADRPSLTPNLTDPTNSSDAPPDFSKGQSPFSQEAVLMNFAAEMQRRHYKYIGILSTNELDVAFLVAFLRNAVPDARLFVMDTDLLLQHEPDSVPYTGTFAVTTYPLLNPQLTAFGQDREESNGERTRLPFSSQFEEGPFDAAVCLINDMLKAPKKDVKAVLGERENCPPRGSSADQNPPLWLTVFGVGGHWPIEVKETGNPPVSKSKSVPNSNRELEDLPLSWQALCALLYFVAGCHVLILLGGWPFSAKFRDFILGTIAPFRRLLAIQIASATLALALLLTGLSAWKASWLRLSAGLVLGAVLLWCLLLTCWQAWVSKARRDARPELERMPRMWITVRIVIRWITLVAATLWANAIMVLLGARPTMPVDRWTVATGFLIGALLATCLLLTWEYGRIKAPEETRSLWQRILVYFKRPLIWHIPALSIPWLAMAGVVFMWSSLVHDDQGHYGAFFSYRAVHLLSAVSPLAPLILLLTVFYLAAIFYVWRLRFDDKARPKLYPDRDGQIEKKDKNKMRPAWRSRSLIADAVNNDWKNLLYSTVIFAIWLLLFRPLRFELFERQSFERLYSLLFYLVILLILISGFRLNRIWDMLRRFLLDVNRQRIKSVFSQLKGERWSSIWFYGAEDADWDFMHRSHEVVQELLERVSPQTAESLEADRVDKAVAAFQRRRWMLQERLAGWSLGKLVLNKKSKRSFLKQECRFGAAQNSLAELLVRILDRLAENWTGRPRFLFKKGVEAQPDQRPLFKAAVEAQPELRALLDRYVALRWESFIRAVLARIRLLIIFLAVSFSLALLSLVIYAFEPHQALIWSVTALFGALGFITVKVMMQIHHDPIIRTIIGGKPREFLGLEFYTRIAALGLAPLLTLLATHFPGLAHSVVSYLQPGLEALK